MRRSARVPKTLQPTIKAPVCSVGHEDGPVKVGRGQRRRYICPGCFNDFAAEKSKIKLPRFVKKPDRFRQVYMNRAMRRAA